MTTEARAWNQAPIEPSLDAARSPRATAVSAELAQIFPASVSAERPGRGPARVRILAGRAPGAASSKAASLGALAAAGLVGLSAGAIMIKSPEFLRPTAAPVQAQLVVTAPASAPVLPPLGPLAPPAPRVVAHAHAQPPQRAHVAHRVQVRAPHKASARRSVRAAVGAPDTVERCRTAPPSERAWCEHGSVMAADARLRHAYDRAVRAGVSRSVLVSYRNRWSGLRDRASWDPRSVASGYDAMADDLAREADRARARGPQRRTAQRGRFWLWL